MTLKAAWTEAILSSSKKKFKQKNAFFYIVFQFKVKIIFVLCWDFNSHDHIISKITQKIIVSSHEIEMMRISNWDPDPGKCSYFKNEKIPSPPPPNGLKAILNEH